MKINNSLPEIEFWTGDELSDLSRQLNRRKGDHLKAQFLKIKASEMLRNDNKEVQKKGISLMKLMIELFPKTYFDTMTGHSILGAYYRSISEYDNAMFHFSKILDYNNSNVSNGKYCMPEMQIALTIIVLNRIDKYEYARTLLNSVNVKTLFVKQHMDLYTLMNGVLNGSRSTSEVAAFYKNMNLNN